MSPIFSDDVTADDRYHKCNDSYHVSKQQCGILDLKTVVCSTECTSKAMFLNNSAMCKYGRDINRSALLTKKRRCSEMECNEAQVPSSAHSVVTATAATVPNSSLQYSKWHSTAEVTIKSALSCTELDLIGDFTRSYCLPTVHNSKHFDLKSISCETV